MLVAVKTLTGKLFKVEAAPESTIGQVKALIEASQSARFASSFDVVCASRVVSLSPRP